jgi:hypothetical protein
MLKIAVGHSEDSEDPAASIRSALAAARSTGSRSPSLCLIFPDSYNPSFQAIIDNIILAMNDFRENLEPQDDATFVAVKVDGDL